MEIRIKIKIEKQGEELEMKTVKFQLEELTCPSCIKKIEGTVAKMKGVEEVKVLFHSSKVLVHYHEEKMAEEQLADTLQRLGYPVLAVKGA